MAWTPLYPDYGGMLPIMKAAEAIIVRDMPEALAWRFGAFTPVGATFKRIQNTQRHSKEFPLLIIQAAGARPVWMQGHLVQAHIFVVEIYIVAEVSGSQWGEQIDLLAHNVIRYLDATMMCFETAPDADWRLYLVNPAKATKFEIQCTNIVFGQLRVAEEVDGQYAHSVAFELQVGLRENV